MVIKAGLASSELVGKRYGQKSVVPSDLKTIVDPSSSAVLIVDMQNDFCSPKGHHALLRKKVALLSPIVERQVNLLRAAKAAQVPLIFVKNITLKNGLSDSPAWARFKKKIGGDIPLTVEGSWGAELIDDIKRFVEIQSSLQIEKHRASAFFETDLDLILRSKAIRTVIVIGTATQGCVLATALHGLFLGYFVVIVTDCVGSANLVSHKAAFTLMKEQFDMAPSDYIISCWQSHSKKEKGPS
ncbi:MAG TPA: isochorismatase family cysteine hydrolase [Nitrososphaerales archaeon]|nr:isochorismatase family cysteine hydrolase [Nitrososphaerales archaeon]